MALRKLYSYQWRLFFPLVLILWLFIAAMVYFQYQREVRENQRRISDELSFVMSRVLNAYERNESLDDFMKFIQLYYDSSPLFPVIRVSVYDNDKILRYSTRDPIRMEYYKEIEKMQGEGEKLNTNDNNRYYYKATRSKDGRYYVLLGMQSSVKLTNTLTQQPWMWFLITVIGIVATIFVYLYSSYFGRTITLLRDFADNVASGKKFSMNEEFPHDEFGDISRHIVKLYQDMDAARTRSEKEHAVAMHAVTEKARLKHQLTNNINHELKTPVGVIKGYLDTIIENPDLAPAMRDKFLRSAQANVDRLTSLLNDVSTMTRLEDGSKSVPVSEVDFHDLVFAIENDLEVTKLAGDMKFTFDIPLDCVVAGNNNLLNGMVENLIKNAAKHSHGTEMGIKLVSESANFYSFSFYDNGTGVGTEHLNHLFERFYRVDTGRSRKVGGTGLGLPIVKNTIEALGGTISVRNRSTGGLEFMFTLKKWKKNNSGQSVSI